MKVAAAEAAFGLGTDEEHSVVVLEEAVVEEAVQDRLGALVEGGQPVPTPGPLLVAHPVFLQAYRDHLLRDEMQRAGGRLDGFYPTPPPEHEQSGRVQETCVRGCEEEAVASAVRSSPSTADALQEGRDRGGGVDLDDPAQVADIDAECRRHSGRARAAGPEANQR
jgi:hypothetical protein